MHETLHNKVKCSQYLLENETMHWDFKFLLFHKGDF